MKKYLSHIVTLLGSIALVLGTLVFINARTNNAEYSAGSNYGSVSANQLPEIPQTMNFAGEKVRLDLPDVYERIDREFIINTFWHSNTILNLKRSSKYLKDIASYIKEEGCPDDFKYLAVVESGLTNSTSPAGAKGFWQFMEGTALQYGLEVNEYVDERYHLERSTRAACAFFKDAYKTTGSWTLAAASYNRGVSGISRALENQKVSTYYDLLLNSETSRYVPRVIAVKYIFGSPEKYGFVIKNGQSYHSLPAKKIEIDREIPDLVQFAKDNGTNYKNLKLLNPWLMGDRLPAKGKKYIILVPDRP